MDFNEYQEFTHSTAIYPESGTGSAIALAYVGLGLGESGEIQGKIKKILRDDGSQLTDEKREALAAEAGDLLYYLARLGVELGVDLYTIAQGNVDKLTSRKDRGVIGGSGDNR
jgi:NTP pyrophosphatase (non-canonical NTP hydrolase)